MVEKQRQELQAPDLWHQPVTPVPMKKFVRDVADTEKLLLFSETGGGKTTFYLNILEYLQKQGVSPENLRMCIIFPDRPTGLAKLHSLIPDEYMENDIISVFQVNEYEDTVRATASSEKIMEEHYKNTGYYGWIVFELMENYWTFSQDYYCRQAYGKSMGDFFAQMQSIIGKNKAEKKTAYEAFAGPFGGPWPIIKFFHNFNWIDKVKRFSYNTVFTSEIKQEENKDSIFSSLGYRPAGEKHNQHRMDSILYLSHKGNNFFMKPFKLTGYTRLYGELNITGKNGYEVHKDSLQKLVKMGHSVSKMKDLEMQAGIKPPEKKKPKEEIVVEGKTHKPEKISQKELKEKPKEKSKEEEWSF